MYKQTLPAPVNLPLPLPLPLLTVTGIAEETGKETIRGTAIETATRGCLKVMLLLITLLLTLVPLFVLADKREISGFSATLEHLFKPLQQSLMRSDVIVSEHGYRVQSQGTGLKQSLIANMLTGNIWFVDHARAMVHELPLTRVEGAPKFPLPMVRLPGFIDSVPCFGQEGTHVGEVLFHRQQLQRWRCSATGVDTLNNELPVEQYFSKELNLVLYSRSESGLESQLLNINRLPVSNKLFAAPEGLRSVGIEEFMGTAPPIEAYRDTDPY